VRELFKQCVLATQYGMEAPALALRIAQPPVVAQGLLQAHRETYRKFWAWSDAAVWVTWTEARKTPLTEYSTKAGLRAAKEAWLGGYLSSQNDLSWFYNTGAPLPDFLKGRDWDVLTAWIDNYCQAHPLDNLDKAAQQLFFELIGGAFANPPKSNRLPPPQ
jgi:hypothetical protein